MTEKVKNKSTQNYIPVLKMCVTLTECKLKPIFSPSLWCFQIWSWRKNFKWTPEAANKSNQEQLEVTDFQNKNLLKSDFVEKRPLKYAFTIKNVSFRQKKKKNNYSDWDAGTKRPIYKYFSHSKHVHTVKKHMQSRKKVPFLLNTFLQLHKVCFFNTILVLLFHMLLRKIK